MKQKYTEKQEDEMKALYEGARSDAERAEVVLDLAERYEKTDRMIIAKLSKMKLYKTIPKVSKVTGKKPETKEQLVKRLEAKFNWPPGDFAGLEKAPKIVLLKLLLEFER